MITRDDWMAALREAEPVNDPNVLTTEELAGMLGIKSTAMRVRLRRLLDDGKVTRTLKRVLDTTGRIQNIAAYKLVKAEPIRKKK